MCFSVFLLPFSAQIGLIRGCFGTFQTELTCIQPNRNRKKKKLRWMRVQPCRQQHSVAMRVGGQVYVDQSLLSNPPQPPTPTPRAGIPKD